MSGAGQQDHWPAVQPHQFDLIFGLLKVGLLQLASSTTALPLMTRQLLQRLPLPNLNPSQDP